MQNSYQFMQIKYKPLFHLPQKLGDDFSYVWALLSANIDRKEK